VAILGDGPRSVALSQWIAMDGEDGMQLLQLPAGTSLPAWVRAEQVDVVVDAARAGEHALLVAPTGAGKTLAGFLATLAEHLDRALD
jgi:MoxR-like ATPase